MAKQKGRDREVEVAAAADSKSEAASVKSPGADSQVEKAHARDWSVIVQRWLAYPPKSHPGDVLAAEFADFQGLSEAARACKAAHIRGEPEYRHPLSGLHQEIVEHGLLYIAKAANVVGCCEVQNATHPTWSISIGYQAALLGLEGVLRLLGLCTVEVDNITVIIDLWAQPPSTLPRRLQESYVLGEAPRFLWSGKIDHFHRWALLQRVLRVVEDAPVPREISSALMSIHQKKFARQRNDLHYRVNWPFADLLMHVSMPHLPTFADLNDLQNSLSPLDERFGIALAFAVLCAGLLLLRDLSNASPAFGLHYQAILQTLNASQHPFFQSFYPAVQAELAARAP